ncbi:dynein light chain binding protein [Aureococcus anophagefferens]|nr:dynein light chain binding protein [Aureococcus anophagefferens]
MAVGPAVADDEGSVGSDASRGRKKGGTPKPAPGGKRNTVAGGRESRASTSASKKARGTMRTRKVTMMAGMAKKDGDAGGDDDEAAKKKKKASARKRASTRAPYRKPKDGEWVEVWYDLRRKQDALGQRWQRWPRNEPGRRATLFGSTLYSTKRDHLASNGFYAHRTTHCLGDPGDPIPPEWLMIRPSRYEEIIMRATVEENWLLEMMVERQLKSLCRNRGALTIFHRFDEDGSGELDGSEFRSMLKSVGEEVDDKKVEWLLGVLDKDGGGSVDFAEFAKFVGRPDRVGVSCTYEDHKLHLLDPVLDLKEALLRLYDPKRIAPKFHPLYTLRNLAKRESLKFEPCIRKHLNFLWKKIDTDLSGRIEPEEYVVMHFQICTVMLELASLPEKLAPGGKIDVKEHRKLALEDWEIDHQGMGFLDYGRFASCWFQIADQFTEKISLDEYDSFLGTIISKLYPPPAEEASLDEAAGARPETAAEIAEREAQEEEDRRAEEAAEEERLRNEELERIAAEERAMHRRATTLQTLYRVSLAKEKLKMKRLEAELLRRSLPTCDLTELDLMIDEDAILHPATFLPAFSFPMIRDPTPEVSDAESEVAEVEEEEAAAEVEEEVAAEAEATGPSEADVARMKQRLEGMRLKRAMKRVSTVIFKNLILPSRMRGDGEQRGAYSGPRASRFTGGGWSDVSSDTDYGSEDETMPVKPRQLPCVNCRGVVACACETDKFRAHHKVVLERRRRAPRDGAPGITAERIAELVEDRAALEHYHSRNNEATQQFASRLRSLESRNRLERFEASQSGRPKKTNRGAVLMKRDGGARAPRPSGTRDPRPGVASRDDGGDEPRDEPPRRKPRAKPPPPRIVGDVVHFQGSIDSASLEDSLPWQPDNTSIAWDYVEAVPTELKDALKLQQARARSRDSREARADLPAADATSKTDDSRFPRTPSASAATATRWGSMARDASSNSLF